MPKWQIDPKKYLERLNFTIEDFKHQLHLPQVEDITKIIPLRDMKSVESLIPINRDLLSYIIEQIRTLGGNIIFADVKIQMVKLDPRHTKIGQRFVYRETYQKILEDIPGIFHRFLVTNGGLGDLGPYFVFGFDENNSYCLACYIPPIIEKHGSDLIIMDGIHRNFIAKQAGMALNAILVEGVKMPFPCSVKDWEMISVIPVLEKPKDINERYFDLNKDLFRDLKYLGIDG